jgi:hypothetical protein
LSGASIALLLTYSFRRFCSLAATLHGDTEVVRQSALSDSELQLARLLPLRSLVVRALVLGLIRFGCDRAESQWASRWWGLLLPGRCFELSMGLSPDSHLRVPLLLHCSFVIEPEGSQHSRRSVHHLLPSSA